MVKKTLSAIIAVLLAVAVLASCAKAEKASSAQKQTKSETSPIPQAVTVPQETNSVEQVLASMTTEEKIEQMIMPSIRYNDNGDREYVTKITDDIRRSLKKHSYAGVDILLMPVTTYTTEGFRQMDKYIRELANLTDKGEIPIKAVDAAVTRILTLKDNNGLLDTYESSDIEERVEKAVSFVGSGTNHDKEWELTERGITLVKNESALPLTNSDEKTVVLVPYDEEITSINYAVNKLTADGKLPSGAAVEVYSYNNKTAKKVLPLIKGADNVIFVSEIYSADGLKNDVSYLADALIERAHANGARFIVMSASLPYDAARFQSSDAIMLAYMPCSMSSDPTGKETEIEQYGPNISAALYMMFSEDDAPSAKLPVDIPELDSTYSFTDSILYERGFGLTYE